MRHLKNGKTPGPDGILNEMIIRLPERFHQEIHKLFILMWMTKQCPRHGWRLNQCSYIKNAAIMTWELEADSTSKEFL